MAEHTVVKVNFQLCDELSKDLHDVVDRWTRRHDDMKDEIILAARRAAVDLLADRYGTPKETNDPGERQEGGGAGL